MGKHIADIRTDYKQKELLEKDVDRDPYVQFATWWDEALKSQIDEVNAMTLATSTKSGIPSARIVLLKSFSDKGFVFFTNYNSEKGRELAENPQASLVFFWKELERQVRISGSVEKISPAESDEYFMSRPEGSRIGAWASPQSEVIASREVIERNLLAYKQQFASSEIIRPAHWGGYLVIANRIEFWQGRPNRLHDRIEFTLKEGNWTINRLAP